MATKAVKVLECKCERCGHEWKSKGTNPKVCPKCKSPYWNEPRKEKSETQEN
jgi:predicted Zn-ribbon and HTH transcriptional regulator